MVMREIAGRKYMEMKEKQRKVQDEDTGSGIVDNITSFRIN